MIYRPLGRTGLELSVLGLGGHWRTADGRRYCDRFVDDEVPADVLANRLEVLDVCQEAGINYVDITTAAECLAYGRALEGRRDRFIVGADDYQWSARRQPCASVESLVANVERCLSRLRTDYLDLWRVTSEVHGHNSDAELATVIEAADRLRQAGKIRHLGLSAHAVAWMSGILQRFDAFEVAIAPVVPTGCGHSARNDTGAAPTAVFERIARCGLGLIAIKPFAAGLVFDAELRADENDAAARLMLQKLLERRPEVTCVVAGMTTPAEARNAIAAVTDPRPAQDQIAGLAERIRQKLGTLPAEYAWLANWDTN